METQTELELFAALAEAFDEDKECEHVRHSDPWQIDFHSGKAEWYLQTRCGNCKDVSPVVTVCDKYRRTVEKMDMYCRKCDEVGPVRVLVKERIK